MRLAHVAPRLLDAVVGALRTPPPLASRMYEDELCRRVSTYMTTSTTAPVSQRDVGEFLCALCGEIAPEWCEMGELRAENSLAAVGGGGGTGFAAQPAAAAAGGGGGRAQQQAAAAAAAAAVSAASAASAARALPSRARRVFKLSAAAYRGLVAGGAEGLSFDSVKRKVEHWAVKVLGGKR